MIAELLKHSSGPVRPAIEQKLETFPKGLDPEILGVIIGPRPIETVEKRGDVDQLGTMVKKVRIGYFTAGHGAGDGVGHDVLILP